ncbi:hsp90 co-chaperone Cdc37-like [Scaptodrosophila lebanonensis]|uniref:Hsp90 co-chaperone Cdc37-like n=1 Tax=Drosophila lebanonensis TaxID=7225 RepID=A0A6J2U128_DROLE|nr:hsp90 co-chaperone Cdc37-like [Scaptodrosophila lebanonensis]
MVDYSKWTNLTDSDDEQPANGSAQKVKQAALEKRVIEFQNRRMDFVMRRQNNEACRMIYRLKLAKKKGNPDHWNLKLLELKEQLPMLEQEDALFAAEEKRLLSDPALRGPTRVGFVKTMINKRPEQPKPCLSLEKTERFTLLELEKRMRRFIEMYGPVADEYVRLESYEDTMRFLHSHANIISTDGTAYLMNMCLDLISAGRLEEMSQVAHQCMILQFIVELGSQMNEDPRRCINPFFTRIIEYDSLYYSAFQTETEALKARLTMRAQGKEVAPPRQQPAASKSPSNQSSPGTPCPKAGLGPFEVFQSLPESLKSCFQTRNVQELKHIVKQLPPDEAKFHLQRCIDTGLWVKAKKQQ